MASAAPPGRSAPDPAQVRAVARLQPLHEALSTYAPTPPTWRGWLSRLGLGEPSGAAPSGIYLWGPVGRGKSMLMDLFFAAAPLAHKRRVHFHAFMLDVHDRIERERRARTRRTDLPRSPPISPRKRRCCASTSSRSTTSPTR